MNTNLKSANLIPLDRKPESNFHNSSKSLALVQSVKKLERSTPSQKEAVSRIYAEQAWIYFQEKNWQGAIVACKHALESNSHNADAYKILGNVLKVKGKKAEALGVYAKALAINPNSAPIYANLGSFYAEQKNWQQALDYYQQAVILDPSFAGAYRSLAQVWEELGDTNQALECLCQAVNLEPEILTAREYFSFGKELYQQGKIKEASIFYIHGVGLNPQAETELAELVKMLEKLEEWQPAVVYYHQLISLSNDNPASRDLSDSSKPIKNLLSSRQSKPQVNNVADSKTKYPQRRIATQDQDAVKLLGDCDQDGSVKDEPSTTPKDTASKLLPEGQTELELKAQSAKKQPDSAVSWNNLGSLYAQKQYWTKAISCYQEAVELAPNLAKTHRNLAKVYSKMGKDDKAALCWYEAFRIEPEQVKPEQYFNLARKLLRQQEVEKAISCLRRTVQLKPNFDQAYLILGKLLKSQGKSEAASACFESIKQQK